MQGIMVVVAILMTAYIPGKAPSTPYPINYKAVAGEVIVNPVIDCNFDVENIAAKLPAGIIVEVDDVTIINPDIRDCSSGVLVRQLGGANGVVPDNVRIIADSSQPGYTSMALLHNRTGVNVDRVTNLEVGDVSAPEDQVGGEFEMVDNYRPFSGHGGIGARIHHTNSYCVPDCSRYSTSSAPGAFWGIKWLAERSWGAPYEASEIRIDHNIVGDHFTDEGIGFDSRANDDPEATIVENGSVASKKVSQDYITLKDVNLNLVLVGHFVVFNEGGSQGKTLKVLSKSGSRVYLNDTDPGVLEKVAVGNRVSIGMRFFHNEIDHNFVDMSDSKSAIDFHGTQTYSRIAYNTVVGLPSYVYPDVFHYRQVGGVTVAQCMDVRSPARVDQPIFSFQNSVVGNTCESGDISATVISWGGYEVDSPNWVDGNTTGAGYNAEWRYKSSEPLSDPWVP